MSLNPSFNSHFHQMDTVSSFAIILLVRNFNSRSKGILYESRLRFNLFILIINVLIFVNAVVNGRKNNFYEFTFLFFKTTQQSQSRLKKMLKFFLRKKSHKTCRLWKGHFQSEIFKLFDIELNCP